MSELLEPSADSLPETMRTERLRIERLCHDAVDLQEYHRVCSSDEGIDDVTRYLSWDPHESIRQTRAYLDMVERQWENGESAAYLLRPREPEDGAGELAGGAGITFDWPERTGTLGVWLRKRFWGRGYSGERAAAFLELAFDRLDLDTVAVQHRADNEKSRRAVEKYVERFGGTYDGRLRNWVVKSGETYDQDRYTIQQAQYRRTTR